MAAKAIERPSGDVKRLRGDDGRAVRPRVPGTCRKRVFAAGAVRGIVSSEGARFSRLICTKHIQPVFVLHKSVLVHKCWIDRRSRDPEWKAERTRIIASQTMIS